ncbi:hydrogenase maturation protease [Nannocystis exedens]|uniref:Hydrogenase maturation protease n=1 Tax=Nannocystis exedens TaxID=54 RepID=A0A1I2FHL1_9BACT|nr:hydrogenase maturation protease [Nannocystis exedens]PCC70434.1 peptidase M52 [Nannocystis exedens]SFF04369.1 hydrogenase maturation protease [Nannocystis exedens]
MTGLTLVAGIGNVFFGDDGFGVAVARRLAARPLPDDVRVVDFGIRGYDLALAMLDPYQQVVIVDAVARGGAPGTLYVLELEAARATSSVDGHGLGPARVLELVLAWSGRLPPVRLVGCESARVDFAADGAMRLTPAVAAAVDGAVELVEGLVARA